MKWYEYRDVKTGKLVWWTQRDQNGNFFEIRKLSISKKFRLFIGETKKQDFDSLNDAQAAAKALMKDTGKENHESSRTTAVK